MVYKEAPWQSWTYTDRSISLVLRTTGSYYMELIHNGMSISICLSVGRLTNWDECELTVNPRLEIGAKFNLEWLSWTYAFLWCNIFATYSLLSSYMLKLKLWCYFAIFSKSQKLNVDWKCQNCILKVKMGNRSFQHYLEFYICFHLELT